MIKAMEPLKNIGLSNEQIAVYQTLLEYGKLPASTLASRTGISRVITYKILEQLEGLGIVQKLEAPKSVATFSPADPENLKNLVEKKKQELVSLETNCQAAISLLKPQFNILRDKPGVRFYEGPEGIQKVLEDSLYTEGEIYTYVDVDAVLDSFKEINDAYVQKREKFGITKKILAADTPRARDYLSTLTDTMTDIRLIGKTKPPFGSAMNIYDDKVSYITIGKEPVSLIGIIIEDARIATMHRYFFECLYDLAQEKTP